MLTDATSMRDDRRWPELLLPGGPERPAERSDDALQLSLAEMHMERERDERLRRPVAHRVRFVRPVRRMVIDTDVVHGCADSVTLKERDDLVSARGGARA